MNYSSTADISSIRETITRVSQHEVGHWIVAKQLGFEPGDISIQVLNQNGSYDGGSGILLFSNLNTKEEIDSFIEKRIIILYAGVMAEWLKNGEIDEEEPCKSGPVLRMMRLKYLNYATF